MLKDIMTQLQHLKSIFQRQSWPVLELLYASLRLVFLSIVTILLTVFSVLIWLLVVMLLSVRELGSMLGGYEVWVQRFEEERSNTQALFHSLRNLNQQSVAVLKTAFEAVQLQFTSLFGIKK